VSDHVKNYRPKVLVLCGPPSTRPQLLLFANMITKRLSLLSSTHIVLEPGLEWHHLEAERVAAADWFAANKVKAFHAVTRHAGFAAGVRAATELQGLGRLAPNMVMLGFKEDWRAEVAGAVEYILALQTVLDMHLSVALLRVRGGLDTSGPEREARSAGGQGSRTNSVSTISVDSGLNISSTPDLRYSGPPATCSALPAPGPEDTPKTNMDAGWRERLLDH
jgi:solute carrier family 12 sodium/potassium/chloride transporter 2